MQIEITNEFLASQRLSSNTPERLWKKVNKNGPIPIHAPHLGRCWVWTGWCVGVGSRKRGAITSKRKWGYQYVHRISWILNNGAIPDKLWVLHRCDTGLCVNPDHLFLGTAASNIDDCIEKNRRACGEKHPSSKLTQEEVLKMRSLYKTGEYSTADLGLMFNVSRTNVWLIVTERIWMNHKGHIYKARHKQASL